VKIGALYALLRDRMIDARRSTAQLAGNDIDIARFETRATAIGVQARAIEAYQKWVESGLKLQAYQALYDIAVERGNGIRRQVQLGAKPEILLTENEANMVKREALVAQARQEFRAAANKLSLYYRDAAGLPVLVDADRLPPSAAAFDGMNVDPFFEIEERPDFGILLEEIEQASVKLALAENDLRPRLDLKGEIAKDIGPAGAGGYSRSPLEVVFGVSLTVPLQNRKARGKLTESRAKLDELSVKQRYLAEKIRAEVAGIGIEVDTARELADATRRQVALADRLAEAERRRFALGSSDFFLVNSREEAATDAAVKLIEARARIAAARRSSLRRRPMKAPSSWTHVKLRRAGLVAANIFAADRQLLGRGARNREFDAESASHARRAFDQGHLSRVKFDQLADQGETDAETVPSRARRPVNLPEQLEDVFLGLDRDPDAGITDLDVRYPRPVWPSSESVPAQACTGQRC
jgi:outer membrane protein TolC